jgi:hypothetical protein
VRGRGGPGCVALVAVAAAAAALAGLQGCGPKKVVRVRATARHWNEHDVGAIIRRHADRCYRDNGVAGRMTLVFQANAGGRVVKTSAVGPLALTSTGACIVQAMKQHELIRAPSSKTIVLAKVGLPPRVGRGFVIPRQRLSRCNHADGLTGLCDLELVVERGGVIAAFREAGGGRSACSSACVKGVLIGHRLKGPWARRTTVAFTFSVASIINAKEALDGVRGQLKECYLGNSSLGWAYLLFKVGRDGTVRSVRALRSTIGKTSLDCILKAAAAARFSTEDDALDVIQYVVLTAHDVEVVR